MAYGCWRDPPLDPATKRECQFRPKLRAAEAIFVVGGAAYLGLGLLHIGLSRWVYHTEGGCSVDDRKRSGGGGSSLGPKSEISYEAWSPLSSFPAFGSMAFMVVFSFWRTESYELYADWSFDNYRTLLGEAAYRTFFLRSLVSQK